MRYDERRGAANGRREDGEGGFPFGEPRRKLVQSEPAGHSPSGRAPSADLAVIKVRVREAHHESRTRKARAGRASEGVGAGAAGPPQSSRMATARVQPAEAPRIFTGKQHTVKPSPGSASRLCSFSRWQ